MITIEVIVSMLILFLVIVASTSTMKHLHMLTLQKDRYEELYITVLNIKEKLSSSICQSNLVQEGEMGNYSYKASCTKVQELQNFFKNLEDDESGNIGDMLVQLYKVDLVVTKEKSYDYKYYLTTYHKSAY